MSEPSSRDPGESVQQKMGVEPSPFQEKAGVEPSPFLPKGVWMALGGTIVVLGLVGGAWLLFKPPVQPPPVNDPPPGEPICGNGFIETGEDCDGSDTGFCLQGQVCENCQCATYAEYEGPVCGDGVRELGETCEPGVSPSNCSLGLVCQNDCTCGHTAAALACDLDDVAEAPEECDGTDPGICQSGQICANCNCISFNCGNNQLEADETCDTNKTQHCVEGEICTTFCTCVPEPTCGNTVIEWGEGCDPPGVLDDTCFAAAYATSCSSTCQCTSAGCGNGVVDQNTSEECEPEDLSQCAPDEVCRDCACALCGNGQVDGVGESCDGDDLSGCAVGQTCYENCTCIWPSVEEPNPLCGNGTVDLSENETCDPPNSACAFSGGPGVCSDWCQCVSASPPQPPPVADPPPQGELPGADGSMCGDGVCQEGESGAWCGDCPSEEGGDDDDGGGDDDSDKDKDKDGDDDDGGGRTAPVCGNGKVESGESCDDGGNNGKCGFCDLSCSRVMLC